MAYRDPGGAKRAETWAASAPGVMALSESFFEPLVAGKSEGRSLVSLFPFQALTRLSCSGSFSIFPCGRHIEAATLAGSHSVDWHKRHLKGHPGWGPTLAQWIRRLMGQPLYCSAAKAGLWGERDYADGSTPYA